VPYFANEDEVYRYLVERFQELVAGSVPAA
jgi:hypothetical protein